jgi:hypothetical protein
MTGDDHPKHQPDPTAEEQHTPKKHGMVHVAAGFGDHVDGGGNPANRC